MDTGYKIFTDILRERLIDELEERNILSETQIRFRAGRGTIDAVYMIKNAVQSIIEKEGEVYAVFVDLNAVFYRVNRVELNETMKKSGVESKLRIVIMKIYEETENVIRVGSNEMGKLWMKDGVRQGCKISAMMFNVYMINMEKELSKINEGGIVVGKKKIWSISYADDIVMLATGKRVRYGKMRYLEP